jgi:phage shock protein E
MRLDADGGRCFDSGTMNNRTVKLAALCALCAVLFCCQGVPKGPDARGDARYVDPALLGNLVSQKTELYILVDVRTMEEYQAGHIPTAINIPYDAIAERVPSPDKSELIIVYCATGRRAAVAKETLDGMGYLRVVDFGGISRWTGQLNRTPLPGECDCRTK